jgi:16S rRNA (cytosine967-C5)-methyltransferase
MTRSAPRGRRRGPSRAVDPARQVAYDVLCAVRERDAYANLLLPSTIRRAHLTGRDAAFATELTYGTLRGRGTYDAVIAACANRPLDQIDPQVLDALRLGTHQLLGTRVPAHAAVDMTVALVRAEHGTGASGFANAVMRRISEHGLDAWLDRIAPEDGMSVDERLALRTSHPAWVVRAMRDALVTFGRPAEELTDLLTADNVRPVVGAVALPGLADVAELRSQGAGPGRWSPAAVTVTGAPEDLPAIAEGRARIQDEGSQLVALTLAAAPIEGSDTGRWLDLCAGPGGKSALLAAELGQRRIAGTVPEQARLVAVETVPARVGLIRTAVRALGDQVDIRQGDGTEIGRLEPDRYDRVLLDAPCTGLGALRRRPEARWRRSPRDVGALGPLQRELLRSALDAVRPGGLVGYVTCSPHPAETMLAVGDVLRRRGDVTWVDARETMTAVTGGLLTELGPGPQVQLWPHLHGTDAMFLSLLRKDPH